MSASKETVSPLYQVDITCPNCDFAYKTSRVRRSFIKTVKTDSDFCVHYKDINPDFYAVNICPVCGFAYNENFNLRFYPHQKEAIFTNISQKWSSQDYSGERSIDDALSIYKIALLSAQATEQSQVIIGGICFKIACFYRYKNMEAQEKRFLQFTLDSYLSFYQGESTVSVNEGRMMYMIGEIYRRLGDFHNAVRWFSRVVNDRSVTDVGIIRRSREQWQNAKAELDEFNKKQKEAGKDEIVLEDEDIIK